MLKGFLLGVVVTVALLILGAYLVVTLGLLPSTADIKPDKLEEWAAGRSLSAAIDRQAKKESSPVPADEANLTEGARLYQKHCAYCHGDWEAKVADAASGFYIEAPQFVINGVEDDPEWRTRWVIARGVRFTAMPAFNKILDDKQLWQLAAFLKNMDKLPRPVEQAWEKTPAGTIAPSAPAGK